MTKYNDIKDIEVQGSISDEGMSFVDKFDIPTALEGMQTDDIVQGIGFASEEVLRSIGNLTGDSTGEEITETIIQGIHYGTQQGAKYIENSDLLDTVSSWFSF